MGWLKINRIVSIGSESIIPTFDGETVGENANNLLFPILVSYQNLIQLKNR